MEMTILKLPPACFYDILIRHTAGQTQIGHKSRKREMVGNSIIALTRYETIS